MVHIFPAYCGDLLYAFISSLFMGEFESPIRSMKAVASSAREQFPQRVKLSEIYSTLQHSRGTFRNFKTKMCTFFFYL